MIIFLAINKNMCFGCSKEPFHRDGSFEYPQHMFWLRNMKIIFCYAFLSGGLFACFFVIILCWFFSSKSTFLKILLSVKQFNPYQTWHFDSKFIWAKSVIDRQTNKQNKWVHRSWSLYYVWPLVHRVMLYQWKLHLSLVMINSFDQILNQFCLANHSPIKEEIRIPKPLNSA